MSLLRTITPLAPLVLSPAPRSSDARHVPAGTIARIEDDARFTLVELRAICHRVLEDLRVVAKDVPEAAAHGSFAMAVDTLDAIGGAS